MKPYEEPLLIRREVLSRVVAAVGSPFEGQGQGQGQGQGAAP